MEHKAGFVNIIGRPNAGKSTLMNALVGERLSIITSKAQTTRHRIMGIVNGENFQIVYSDTPGIINKPAYRLQESMMNFVEGAFSDADMFLFIVDPTDNSDYSELIAKFKKFAIPVIVVINKIDLLNNEIVNNQVEKWVSVFPDSPIIPASALHNFNLQPVLNEIIDKLPVNPPYFPKDDLTDRPVRFFISEIIREKLLLFYKQEIPYSCEVTVPEYKEGKDLDKIRAVIYVARESQKGIIIGKGGLALKRTGTEARKDIENFLQKKVFLEIFVKVLKDWRDDENMLKKFGYE